MGNCISKKNQKVGFKKTRTVETSTHIDQKVFQLRRQSIKRVYTTPKVLKSPPIKNISLCSDSDAASDY